MKINKYQIVGWLLCVLLFSWGITTIKKIYSSNQTAISQQVREVKENELAIEEGEQTMEIQIHDTIYPVIVYDTPTTTALWELLPLTIRMEDHQQNEKFYYLDSELPTNAKNVGTIKKGDIMLFGDRCLVIFYEDFKTSFSYTRIGYLENVDQLYENVGRGDVKVTFRR